MVRIEITGYKVLEINHLVLDYNGTIAIDGKIIPETQKLLNELYK